MNTIKHIYLLFFVILLSSCNDGKNAKTKVSTSEESTSNLEKKEPLNIFKETDIKKIETLLSAIGDVKGNTSLTNDMAPKPWFWEIYFDTKDSTTQISAIYSRYLTSPYLTRYPHTYSNTQLKLESFHFSDTDSTETQNYKSSLFPLDSINLKLLPKLATEALNLHQQKSYKQQGDTIVGIKIYQPTLSLLSKINIMYKIGNPNKNYYRDPTNNRTDKQDVATYEFTHKGKFLHSENRGRRNLKDYY